MRAVTGSPGRLLITVPLSPVTMGRRCTEASRRFAAATPGTVAKVVAADLRAAVSPMATARCQVTETAPRCPTRARRPPALAGTAAGTAARLLTPRTPAALTAPMRVARAAQVAEPSLRDLAQTDARGRTAGPQRRTPQRRTPMATPLPVAGRPVTAPRVTAARLATVLPAARPGLVTTTRTTTFSASAMRACPGYTARSARSERTGSRHRTS